MNIPNTLWVKPETQIGELSLKSFITEAAPDGSLNEKLMIRIISFRTITNGTDTAVTSNSPSEASIEITGPERIEDKSSADLAIVIQRLSGHNAAAGGVLFSTKDAIYSINSASANVEFGMALNAPLLALAGQSVTLKAYGATYQYTFPSVSNLASWTPILGANSIAFEKQA